MFNNGVFSSPFPRPASQLFVLEVDATDIGTGIPDLGVTVPEEDLAAAEGAGDKKWIALGVALLAGAFLWKTR